MECITNTRTRAHEVASFIKLNFARDLDNSESLIDEQIHCLFVEDENFDPISYADLVVAVMGILSNPENSKQLNVWQQKNAGKLFYKMYTFFEMLSGEEFQKFLDHLSLGKYSGCLKEEGLRELEMKYSSNSYKEAI